MAKTAEAKARRAVKRKLKKAEFQKLTKIVKAGKPLVSKKLVGKGDYSMLKAKMRGRGDYLEDVANGGAQLVGKGIRYVGEKALGWLSGAAKGLLGSLLGSGDYTASGHPRANSMSATTSTMPQVESTRGRGNIVRNTEMIASIFAHDTLQTTEWHISPGLANTFPWLHPMGDMYQEWRMNGGVITYVPTVAPLDDAAGGDLVINVEYDLESPMPTTIQEVTGSYLAVAGRPLDRMVMAIECAPHETPYNVYLTRTTEVLDAPHYPYDLGKLRVTVANQPTASNGKLLGRLYFTYEMEFFKPMVRSIPLTIPFWRWNSKALSSSGSVPFLTTEADFNAGTFEGSTIKPAWISATKIQFPSFMQSGKWLCVYQDAGAGAGIAGGSPTITMTNAATSVPIFHNGTGILNAVVDSNTTVVLQVPYILLIAFEVTGPSPTLAITGGTWDSGQATIQVLPLSGDILEMNRALRINRDYFDRKSLEAVQLQQQITRCIDFAMEEKRREPERVQQIGRRWTAVEKQRYLDAQRLGYETNYEEDKSFAQPLIPATKYDWEQQRSKRLPPTKEELESLQYNQYGDVSTSEKSGPNGPPRLRDPSPARQPIGPALAGPSV